jgi:hypothetical protein
LDSIEAALFALRVHSAALLYLDCAAHKKTMPGERKRRLISNRLKIGISARPE